jgi:hypothetical protein
MVPADTLKSSSHSSGFKNPWDLFEARAEVEFWQTPGRATTRVQSTPVEITDRDCLSHTYEPEIKRLGPPSNIPQLLHWYSSPAERLRQILGLLGNANHVDDTVSALKTAVESARQKLNKGGHQGFILEAEVRSVLQALLSRQSELEEPWPLRDAKPCREKIANPNFCFRLQSIRVYSSEGLVMPAVNMAGQCDFEVLSVKHLILENAAFIICRRTAA